MVAKAHPVNAEYEAKAKNLLKAELKRRGVTYAQLAERITAMGLDENELALVPPAPQAAAEPAPEPAPASEPEPAAAAEPAAAPTPS